MSAASKSAIFSKEIVNDFEDALDKLKVLSKHLTRESVPSSCNDASAEHDDKRAELEALELKFQTERAQFEAGRLEWEATKGDVSKLEKTVRELEEYKLKTEAEREPSVKAYSELKMLLQVMTNWNPVVFFDTEVHGEPLERIVVELYKDTSPRLAEIFRTLCTGEKHIPGTNRLVGYKGSEITYLNPGSYFYGGNVRVKNAEEFSSIFGTVSSAEVSAGSWKGRGPGDVILCINNIEPSKSYSFLMNGSRGSAWPGCPLIGRVIQGMDVVNAANFGFPNGEYLQEGSFVITDCGQLF